jgi:ADP-dependent NAD(P)H-hydrate dehydratase / NAD(P)H-hydrate epimerase
MRELDRLTIERGTPEAVLVERAGAAVARHARTLLGGVYGRRVVIACGKGNNGADGRVAAGVLRGWGVHVVELQIAGDLDRDDAAREIARADLFVDAMFGTGFRGALEGDAAWLAETATRVPRVLAVDIPSGVDGLTGAVRGAAVRAHATVAFAFLKPGLLFEPGRTLAGTVDVVDIGIVDPLPRETETPGLSATTASDARRVLGARAPDEHKWRAAVLVVGGSAGMIGAPGLAARAALRSGSGMVVAAVPGAEAAARVGGGEVVARVMPATATGGLDSTAADELLGSSLARFKALALGPGLGRASETAAVVARLVAEAPLPLVIDADALTLLADDPEPLARRAAAARAPAVVTPHDGEYGRLAGHPVGDDRVGAARELASRLGAIVVLKGPATVVAHPRGHATINPTGGPELATAGTGDVLTGIVAALLARAGPTSAFEAAAAAAWIHGRAAADAGTAPGLVAGDLIDALPRTLRRLSDPSED